MFLHTSLPQLSSMKLLLKNVMIKRNDGSGNKLSQCIHFDFEPRFTFEHKTNFYRYTLFK